jgi:hypothetical protein
MANTIDKSYAVTHVLIINKKSKAVSSRDNLRGASKWGDQLLAPGALQVETAYTNFWKGRRRVAHP